MVHDSADSWLMFLVVCLICAVVGLAGYTIGKGQGRTHTIACTPTTVQTHIYYNDCIKVQEGK